MSTIHYAEFQQKLTSLVSNTIKLLNETGNKQLVDELQQDLQNTSERKELRLAFVGQYSSGKSTIISALTGNKDIVIDANVATDKVSEYKWNNISLMDTPGILAGKVERHDEATKEALNQCDLIFYVLTSQLFDDLLFNNFIDLAYEQHLADKIFIVVNKMNMESGNYDELVDNYLVSLNKIFQDRGYDLSQFPIAFIDANDFIEGIEDADDEFIQMSRFEQFIDKLNAFVSRKGVIKKQYDTPVRLLQSYVKDIAVSAVDTELAEFYRQFEAKITNAQNETKRDVENILYSFDGQTMNKVIALSQEIGDSELSEQDWNIKQNKLNDNLTEEISNTSLAIEKVINENYVRLMDSIEEFGQKEALVQFQNRLDVRLKESGISFEERKNLERQMQVVDWLKKGANKVGEKIADLAPGVGTNGLFSGGISAASGSQLHSIVKNVGHFFGKSFKPWEAVRWASNIAKVAKFGIPIITCGIDIWMQVRDVKKENQRMQQIKESKNMFITQYQTEINRVKAEFERYLQNCMDNYNHKRNEINTSKNEIIRMSEQNEALTKRIHALEGEYIDFIEVINKE
jgi:tRNA U34 5-carboxymethylaminomethyl modifying GTPase MnmE/TrmE